MIPAQARAKASKDGSRIAFDFATTFSLSCEFQNIGESVSWEARRVARATARKITLRAHKRPARQYVTIDAVRTRGGFERQQVVDSRERRRWLLR
jgi:hypothetical protein